MRNLIILYGVLLIVGHLFMEAHSILYAIYPESANINMDLFWSRSFKMEINILWYIKMIGDDLCIIITYYVLTNIAYKFSSALFFVSSVFLLYHIIDLLLFCYNYKRTVATHWVLLAAVIASVFFIITKRKTYSSSVISIE